MQDQYVQNAVITVTESAINTLTFNELDTGVAMFEKVAFIIHRLQWYVDGSAMQELIAVTDRLDLALVGNNKMTVLDIGDQAVYDFLTLLPIVTGTAANMVLEQLPTIRDFSGLPGGGIIIPPRPIYAAIKATGFAAVAGVHCRIQFTYKKLKAEEYWELVEATRMIE